MYITVGLEFFPISIFLTLKEKQNTICVQNKLFSFPDFAINLICVEVEMLSSDHL